MSSTRFWSLPARPPRPVLLGIVFGVFLVIVGVTATSQAGLVSAHFSAASLNAIVSSDAATVRGFVNGHLTAADLDADGIAPARLPVLGPALDTLILRGEILHVELRTPDGTVLLSEDSAAIGARPTGGEAFAAAAERGEVGAEIVTAGEAEAAVQVAAADLLREHFPIKAAADDRIVAVVSIWRDAAPLLAQLEQVRRDVVLVTLTAALVAAGVLFLVFRAAQGRITRQSTQLIEATRRDALTGTLNHGSLVAAVAEALEQARSDGKGLAIAVIDIDGFRLLNETYGHGVGDGALLDVVDVLRRNLPPTMLFGRYGPDEVLVVARGQDVAEIEPAIHLVRTALADRHLAVAAPERIPVTVSAGISMYPAEGESVTALLTSAALALGEAKASGGDAVRLVGRTPDAAPETRTFDVLQGLVFAVDTKDRYTKRHSEDVARYAVFLGGRLGLDGDAMRTLRVAGLLHDVGKIGIPDAILRKPGRLTDAEFGIVKQHVALGDLIVRDLPNVDEIRAGIRHHHERWDGDGYLDRLAGEEIPLIGRILAIGDAFSAMTTTRPYRKALDVREALRRLEDAAGTQLDERLVAVFVEGIETVADAPLPGADAAPARLWTPYSQVA